MHELPKHLTGRHGCHNVAPMSVEAGSQSIDRAALVLRHLMESDDFVSLNTMVEGTLLSKTTTARTLRALERNGLAHRGASGGYRPGPALIQYAQRGTSTGDLAAIAWPHLERLGAETGETTNIGIPTPAGIARIAQIDSQHPLGAGNWVGQRIPIHTSAMGKLFLAFGAAQPPFGRLEQLGPNTITDIPELLKSLDQVRALGYATTWEELDAGLCSVAAPVRIVGDRVIAALSISAPTVRTSTERLDQLRRYVQTEAAALTTALQGRAAPPLRGAP